MKSFQSEQSIKQLEKRKGGYFYLKIDADIINQFENKRKTRFLCTLERQVTFQCGLNHLGEGNFFIILSTKNLQTVGKQLGETIAFEIAEDPNPLGVEMPEILEVLLEQDDQAKRIFEALTLGKKRNIIHTMSRIKDVDKKVQTAIQLLYDPPVRRNRL